MPLSLLAAGALTTFGQALDLLRAAGETLGVSGLLDRAISLVSRSGRRPTFTTRTPGGNVSVVGKP